jgi:hypothetical protein
VAKPSFKSAKPTSNKQKDNSTFEQKARLRSAALRELAELPVIMETHGGYGKLFLRCYRHVPAGVVFEEKPEKTAVLARQRPTWAVYEADCERAIRAGVGAHLVVNFLDLDPYGQPWDVLDAFFESERPRAPRLVVVVNDGLRRKLKMNGGWSVRSLREIVERNGNAVLYRDYLAICRELVIEKAAKAGYGLRRWTGYYCGSGQGSAQQMSHYAAVLER